MFSPIRPQQADLFGEPVANTVRIDPRRALIKFKVRRDWDGHVPLEKAHQLGLMDSLEDRDGIAAAVTSGQPLSEREVLRILDGSDTSGHQRARLNTEIEEILLAVYHRGKRSEVGYHVTVCCLFQIVSKDLSFMRICPEWLVELFLEEEELLFEVFHGNHPDKRPTLGDSSDEDEDDEPSETDNEEEE